MSAETITNIAIGFVIVWSIVSVLGALFMARDTKWEPLPPEEPHHH